jgi:hypothetical protein
MKAFVLALLYFALQSCGNDKSDEAVMKDPAEVRPPSENIPDSMAIKNDSVIVPDTTPNNGSQVGKSDSIHKKQ